MQPKPLIGVGLVLAQRTGEARDLLMDTSDMMGQGAISSEYASTFVAREFTPDALVHLIDVSLYLMLKNEHFGTMWTWLVHYFFMRCLDVRLYFILVICLIRAMRAVVQIFTKDSKT